MTATMEKPKRRIAVADDNPTYLVRKSQVIEVAGFEAVPLKGKYNVIQELLDDIGRMKAEGLVCDHKLIEGNYAGFQGAEAVAALYGSKIPAILVTDYVESDVHTIRKYRRKVPVLIRGGKFVPSAIASGINAWEQEVINKDIPVQRRPRRAVIMIDDVSPWAQWRMFTVFVPRWREHEAIPLSEELFPAEFRPSLKKGSVLTANVNTEAESSEDLYFEDFKLTPDEDLSNEPA
jgi:hypothetical protein